MKFRLSLLFLLCFTSGLSAQMVELPSPAGAGAMGPAFARSPGGDIHLSWVEPAGETRWAMKFSRFDAEGKSWAPARTIAQGENWFINWADFPQLAVQRDRMTAVWFVENPAKPDAAGHHSTGYHARYRQSSDGGATWSEPQPVTAESGSVEFVALHPLPDGRLMAAWLDGRERTAGKDRQALYARIIGSEGPDRLVDPSVCDCCQLSMIGTADGGLLLAYRGRTGQEVRDIRLARFRDNRWESPAPLHDDGWQIAACPVNGPRLTGAGEQSAVVWFTSAGGQPQVLAAPGSSDGTPLSPPVRLDLGRPLGRVDSGMSPDGTIHFTWLESTGESHDGGIYLRTLAASGELSTPRLLAATKTTRASGFPRIAFPGGAAPGGMLLAYTRDDEPSRVATQLLMPGPD